MNPQVLLEDFLVDSLVVVQGKFRQSLAVVHSRLDQSALQTEGNC